MVGGYSYDEKEKLFAEKIQTSFTGSIPKLETTGQIAPFKMEEAGGSTDVADISWVVPTTGLRAATWVPGTAAHSWQAVAAGGTSIGSKGMIVAAKAMTLTIMDLYNTPKVIEESWKELKKVRGENFVYDPLVGTRKPALDYRK
jgi:aminobenzoyl-glutamate utilization protein B